jgi:hypothetical protein
MFGESVLGRISQSIDDSKRPVGFATQRAFLGLCGRLRPPEAARGAEAVP